MVSNLEPMFFGLFRQGCHNCVYVFKRTFWGRKLFSNKTSPYLSFLNLWDQCSVFWQTVWSMVIKTALFMSGRTFREAVFFKKILFVIFFVLWARIIFNFGKMRAGLPNLPSMFPLKVLRNKRVFGNIIIRPITTSKSWAQISRTLVRFLRHAFQFEFQKSKGIFWMK